MSQFRLDERATAPDTPPTGKVTFFVKASDKSLWMKDDTGAESKIAGAQLREKSVTIQPPSATEDITLFYADVAITITKLRMVLRGTTPSLTWTIRHGSDRSAAGIEVVTGGTVTTDTTTGDVVITFDDPTIPAGSFVWLETTAKSGVVDAAALTLTFTED